MMRFPQHILFKQFYSYILEKEFKVLHYIGIKPWVLYFDGSNHVNGVGIGVILISPSNTPAKILLEIQPWVFNEVEYEALIMGLETLLNLGAKDVLIRGDSELVINELTHKYKCSKSNLLKYFSYLSKMLLDLTKSNLNMRFERKIKKLMIWLKLHLVINRVNKISKL